jgi:hypothetical protein
MNIPKDVARAAGEKFYTQTSSGPERFESLPKVLQAGYIIQAMTVVSIALAGLKENGWTIEEPKDV